MIFFSYSHNDSAEVERIRHTLIDHPRFNSTVWIDSRRMEAGQDLNKMMYDGIQDSSHVVCFLSQAYVKSEPCMFELKLALTLERQLIPVVVRPQEETFPFGCDELADLLPDTILRVEETVFDRTVDKIVNSLGTDIPRRRMSREGSFHRGSPSEYEAQDFLARESLTSSDLRNIRSILAHGQGETINDMLKNDLSLGGRFALLRMANDAPPTHRPSA